MASKTALQKVQSLAKRQVNEVQKTLKSKKKGDGHPQISTAPPFVDISSKILSYEPLEVPNQSPVPKLANKLDRVLFSPGVHFLKDPRTNVYNFDPKLEQIMSITDFDFSKIPRYIPAGRDSKLSELAGENNKKYTGSTSSLTPVLTQLHHAISHQRPPQILNLSKYFPGNLTTFSAVQRTPTNMWLVNNPKTRTYAVTMPGDSQELILTLLGQAMETMLTTECNEFAKWSKHHPENKSIGNEDPGSTYNYTTCGAFLMRSQLDCYDPRLPGTGMFDLKTRACCAVRHDIDYAQINDGSNYHILKTHGQYESFAREFYELVRSAMFKYSLQARIGRMDGIFVAYHSVRRLFGFEYLPLSEIDKIFHSAQLVPEASSMRPPSKQRDAVDLDSKLSNVASIIADKEFMLSVNILGKLFDTLQEKIRDSQHKDLNIVVHCNGPGQLIVFARPGNYGDANETKLLGPGATKTVPEDLRGYRVRLTQTINNKFIPTTRFPSLQKQSDDWQVKAHIEPLTSADLEARFAETQSQYVHQELTSEPQTVELPGAEELKSMLSKLPEATELQALLRNLDKKGEAYAEWDDRRPKIEL